MIERFSHTQPSQPTSQTLIGNLLQLNAIIIRDSVSQASSPQHIEKKSGDNKKLWKMDTIHASPGHTMIHGGYNPWFDFRTLKFVSRDCSLFLFFFSIIIFSQFYYLILFALRSLCVRLTS